MSFEIGDKATFILWTDRRSGTIIDRKNNTVTWQADKQKLINGPRSGEPDAMKVIQGGFTPIQAGSQRWHVEPDKDGLIKKFSLRKNGRWKAVGTDMNERGGDLVPGSSPYYDFEF